MKTLKLALSYLRWCLFDYWMIPLYCIFTQWLMGLEYGDSYLEELWEMLDEPYSYKLLPSKMELSEYIKVLDYDLALFLLHIN